MLTEYLTEERLGGILINAAPRLDFIHDKSVPDSTNKRLRPDYRCEELKLIVEFDGDGHYCKAEQIIRDRLKDEDYSRLGYRIFRIPYFIQMTGTLLSEMLGHSAEFEQCYPHGFIDKKVIFPANYCELGVAAFRRDLERFGEFHDDIILSLRDKVAEKGDVHLVLPPSLVGLI